MVAEAFLKYFLKRRAKSLIRNLVDILQERTYEESSERTFSEIRKIWERYDHVRRIYKSIPKNVNDLRRFPILDKYPQISREELPFRLRIFSRLSSTTGTTKRKIVVTTPIDLHHLATLMALAEIYNYRSEKGVLFISSGYAPEGVPYGSFTAGRILEIIYPCKAFYHEQKNRIDNVIRMIRKRNVEVDTLLIFSAWLPLIMEEILPKIPLSKDVKIVWMGDILTKGTLSYILESLKKLGVKNITFANYYGCVEANFIGIAPPIKVTSADDDAIKKLTTIRIYGYPSFLTFLEYSIREDLKVERGRDVLLHNDLKKGNRYILLLNAIATTPLLNYYVKDVVEYLGFENGKLLIRVIGRMPFVYKIFDREAFSGEYLRVKGYTMRTNDLISVLDSISSTYLVIFEESPKGVDMTVYSDKEIKIEDIIRRISEKNLKWSLWAIIDQYKRGVLNYRNVTGEEARKFYNKFSKEIGRKIPKVLVIK